MLDADTADLIGRIVAIADDKKAFQIAVLDIAELTSMAEAFIICSAGSVRQVEAIADAIRRQLAKKGTKAMAVEGKRGDEWVLIDYGFIIVHVFTEEKRSYYDLERLWSDAEDCAAQFVSAPGATVALESS